MFDRICNGFSLARSSWSVLVKDTHLILFPIISGILFLIVVVSFAIPLGTLVDWNQLQQHMQRNNNKPPIWVYPVTFAFYFCCYFVIIFCNSALVSCALLRFNGQEPSLGDGFRAATARLPQIFAWALVSATVGLLLKAIENAHERVGYYISMILGSAWSVMTFFVVPVLVVEKVGPFAAVSRSISLLSETWGEALVGRFGLGLFLFLLAIPVFLLFVAGIVLLASGSVAVGVALIVAGAIALLVHSAISAALHTILLAALYQFASEKRIAPGFDRNTFEGAFTAKAAA
jgi:hypothetical protein